VLLSASACLAHAGGFDHLSLAAMVLLYLAALVRAAVQSERSFRVGSRLKNEATSMAARLRQTHQSLQESTKRLAHRASHDALTGLLNREGFTQAAARHGSPRRETTHGVLLLDLDGFKGVNDAFGHQAGDQLLSDVGGWLRRQLHGREGLVGRWGGDEFVVLHSHPRRGHREAAVALAESLIASLPRALGRHASHVGVSIGIAVAQGSDVVEMINLADEALYEAKRAGRNRYRLVDEALHLRLAVRRDVERDLVDAIRTRSLRLWFQPIVTCAERGIHSLEALLRWDHPVHGRIPPEQLIFAAASTGRAEALLRYIVEETCTALHALNDSGSALAWAPVAINVSPREMTQLAVDELVLGMLAERGVAPHRLKIEITEELALDTQAARTRLNTLSAAGVTIVVDDFGVGYSSLASLRDNYVSQVKVDRSFVSGLKASPGNQVLVSAIVQLGRSLNIEVVAEGVETADDLQVLRSLGCGLAQGYHFARPAPLADIVEWARRHEAASAPVR
jgi:diguanylate cyclase (GGDEF)-like protein